MIPLCLVVGDSTAVGTAEALADQGMRCAVHARVGAPASETARTLRAGSEADRVLIAVGSNDAEDAALARNLIVIRQKTSAGRVTWLAPYHAGAAKIVGDIATRFGDEIVWLSAVPSRDRVHPASYRRNASSLSWDRPELGRRVRGRAPSANPPPAIRQAVIMRF